MHRTTRRFWQYFDVLPENAKEIARRNFDILKTDPLHPSLHFKKVGKFWSVRIGLYHRALAIKDGDDFIWVWIGNHKDYDRLVGEHS